MRMMKQRSGFQLATVAMLLLSVSLSLFAGCHGSQPEKIKKTVFTSFLDIPGLTEEDIRAVDALRQKYGSFIYGALASTEAFYDENGKIRGFTALFCEWLTELFDIEFVPVFYEWGELYPNLKADFTGELTATPQRTTEFGFIFSDAIASHSTKYFRIAGSQPRSEIIRTRPLNLAFFEGSTTARSAIAKLEETAVPFISFYINDFDSAYKMLKDGAIDALVHEMIVEAAFDEMGDIIVEDFFPLIYEPVSISTQKVELKPIIDIIQKALDNGAFNHLADMYEQGMKEYARYKFFMRLDEQELAYLHENTAVAYLAEFDNYPISFYNRNEHQWQGIAFDILDEITILTGLTFEPIHEPNISFFDLLAMLENGEGAMLSEVIHNPTRADRFLWPDNNTAEDNFVAITLTQTPNISVHRIMQYRIGVQKGTAHADLFYTWFPGHPYVIEYSDANVAFAGLENGEIDILMYSMRDLLIATNYHEKPGFKAGIIFDYLFPSTFGFNKNEALLCSIVDKAMNFIDRKAIAGQWMRKTFDYRSKIVESQRPWLIGAIVLFLVVIILTFALYLRTKNVGKRLDTLVQQRTAELDISRQELSSALNDAKAANNAKSAFLATMSHEIRTPMNAIIGIAQVGLQKPNILDEYAVLLERIYSSGISLLGIINDILDLSKVETGKLELNPVEYDVPSLINDAVQLNIVRIGSKPIEFILDADETLPSRLYGDELRIKQILNNLLSNAIKYTERGQVNLSVSHSAENGNVSLRFMIKDTGQGMKQEDKERIFSEYTRFNTEMNRATEGTGIGLAITKRLVEMMDGRIEIESEYGIGSVFTVSIMQKAVECPIIGAELANELRNFTFITGKRQNANLKIAYESMPYGSVLIVDDVETNLFVAKGLLEQYKIKVETAKSGFAAIKLIENGNSYDIVFMDHMMPHMDGIETTQKLREQKYDGAIVALTANALVGNDEIFAQNGFNGFISKPINSQRLNSILNEFVRDRYPEEARKYKQETILTEVSAIDAKVLQIFCGDAEKAIPVLRETVSSGDIKLYTTTVHAMKSALANIGEFKISESASRLENAAGHDENMEYISANTEAFVEMLQNLIDKIKSERPSRTDNIDTDEDTAYLTEQLRIIKSACEGYDEKTAYETIDRLKEKRWKPETAETIEKIRDALFYASDFDGAAEMSEELLEKQVAPS